MNKLISLLLTASFSLSLFAYSPVTPEYHQIKTIIRQGTLFQEQAALNPYKELKQLDITALDWSESQWNHYLDQFLTPQTKSFLEAASEKKFHTKDLGKSFKAFINRQYVKVRTLGREHGMAIVVTAIIIEIVDWTLPPLLVAVGLPQVAALLFALPEFEIFMGTALLVQSTFTYIRLVRLYGGIRIRHHYAELHRDVLKELHLKKNKGSIIKFPHVTTGFVLMPNSIIKKLQDLGQKKIKFLTIKNLKEFLQLNILMTESYEQTLNAQNLSDEEKIIKISFDLTKSSKSLNLLKDFFKDQWLENLKEVDENNEIQEWAESSVLNVDQFEQITKTFDSLIIGDQRTYFFFQVYNQFILSEYTDKTPGNHINTFHALHKKFIPFLVLVDKNPFIVWDNQLQSKIQEYFSSSFNSLR